MSKQKYEKLSPIEHMLKRPDMYIGTIKNKKQIEYVMKDLENPVIVQKEIISNEGLVRIFVEIISNSIDNYIRSKDSKTPVKKIKVNIDKDTGETSVWNDGQIIPIEINEKEDMYNHSLIFGNLLAGSNFDDTQDRFTSGKNGIGSTATNIFSKEFKVIGIDPLNNKKLTQVWNNNMTKTDGPVVRKSKLKAGSTEISWFPEFERFGLEGYTEDILSVYYKIVYDTAMICNDVNVYLNNKLIKIKKLQDYAKFYENVNNKEMLCLSSEDCEVVITSSNTKDFQQISFVNGIYTKHGGCHVDKWVNYICNELSNKFNTKKEIKISKKEFKQFFRIFVKAKVNKPIFNSQSKTKLESPGIKINIDKKHITKISKWGFIQDIKDTIKAKEMVSLKKTQRKKRGFVKIEGMDQANYAGTSKSKDCTLIICEGLSAKTYAVCGLNIGINDKKGRNYNGILSLRGKCLNTRNASTSMIAKNKEVSNLIKALGLQYGVDYTKEENFNQLRYGKIALLADADCDGIHIESLIINIFHSLFPSILKRKKPYIISLKTPIVRIINKRKDDILFYDEMNSHKFIKENSKCNVKYYKGLGTTKAEDVPHTFGKKIVNYNYDSNTDRTINKAFNKELSNERKEWLVNYNPKESIYSLDNLGSVSNILITDFINCELIKFSINDCARSIPSLVDGLKNSQRKVLYCVKKRNLKFTGKSLKVAQLGGYVAEHSNYHHGEQNLYDTIVKLAQDYVGSNNIPLLYRDGQFGSRIQNGKDAASARYIYTKMDNLTELLFPNQDDVLLERVIDDGDEVEPVYYVPIIPMILINGCGGIGTGFSSNIPCYNPVDIVEYIKHWLKNKSINKEDLKPLIPWYKNFKGDIKEVDKNRYKTFGKIEENKTNTSITEIPIGKSIDSYKSYLEDMYEDKKIQKLYNHSTQNEISFTFKTNDIKSNVENFKLHSYLSTNNMVLFDENGQIKKYNDVYSIIENFCNIRYKYYQLRKKYIIKNIEEIIKTLSNKLLFILGVINNEITLMNTDEQIVIKQMISKKIKKKEGSYEYLLNMPVRSFTSSKVKKLKDEIKIKTDELNKIKNTSEENMWNKELDVFMKTYLKS